MIKKILALAIALVMVFALSSCKKTVSDISDTGSDEIVPEAVAESLPQVDMATQSVAGTALDSDVVLNSTIKLNGTSVSADGSGVTVNGSAATVTKAGTYLVEGSLSDGQIIVNTTDEENVKLILNGVDIKCSKGSPIYVVSAPKKVVIHLQNESKNIVSDGTDYRNETGDASTAAIYSKDDLKISGAGSLYVNGNCDKGIVSKDDLEIENGKVYVVSVDDGIRGKDSVTVAGGYVCIEAGADGVRTDNAEEDGKGTITVSAGEMYVSAAYDGLQADKSVTVSGGTLVISTGGGSENASTKVSDNQNGGWGSWNGGGKGGNMIRPQSGYAEESVVTTATTTVESTSDSAKGIKSDSDINITGGSITIDSSDDSVHAANTVSIGGGTLNITSGDDGIHSDTTLNISGGAIQITKSYEGLEALEINISGGTARVTSSDDGINAAGGNDGSGMNRPGQNSFSSCNSKIKFSGGYVVVNSSGDGVDSNGSIEMTAGTVIVFGPVGNGNGALDYDAGFTVSGGTILAVGSSGMAQSVTTSSQKVLASNVSGISEGTLVYIQNSSGKTVLAFESAKSASNIVYCSPDLSSGNYTVFYGGSCSGIKSDGVYSGGTCSGGAKLVQLSIK